MKKHVALPERTPYKLDKIDETTELNHAKGMKISNSPFEVPNELRDFAERSVEQARKAFEGFMSVAQKTAGGAGGATDLGAGGAESVGAHVLSYTERNVN